MVSGRSRWLMMAGDRCPGTGSPPRSITSALELDHRALETLHDAGVGRRPRRERSRDLLVTVEVAAAVGVELSHRGGVVRKGQGVDLPAAAVEARIAGCGGGD